MAGNVLHGDPAAETQREGVREQRKRMQRL